MNLKSKSGVDVQLGDVVKDDITGFSGVVIAVTTWLHGCRRIVVQPQKLNEGKPGDPQTFDEPQLWVVKAQKYAPTRETGGPKDAKMESASTRR